MLTFHPRDSHGLFRSFYIPLKVRYFRRTSVLLFTCTCSQPGLAGQQRRAARSCLPFFSVPRSYSSCVPEKIFPDTTKLYCSENGDTYTTTFSLQHPFGLQRLRAVPSVVSVPPPPATSPGLGSWHELARQNAGSCGLAQLVVPAT